MKKEIEKDSNDFWLWKSDFGTFWHQFSKFNNLFWVHVDFKAKIFPILYLPLKTRQPKLKSGLHMANYRLNWTLEDAMIMKLPIWEFLWEDMVAQKIDKYPLYLEFILEGLKSRTRLLRNTTLPLYIATVKKNPLIKNSIFWWMKSVYNKNTFEEQIWTGMYSRPW